MQNYTSFHRKSIEQPEAFWGDQAKNIAWFEPPETVLHRNERGLYRWFQGGKLNTSYLALDYHIEQGRGDQPALIYDSPVTDTQRTYTYRELRDEVARIAGGLRDLGLEKGDRVVIYMPMIPEAAMAMLACARLGVIHSLVFGGFAPPELAVRIDDAQPKVLLTASGGIEITRKIAYKPLVDRARELAEHKVDHVVLLQRPEIAAELNQPGDQDWHDWLKDVKPAAPVSVDATDPLYILYTSGTTGKPKGIVRDNGGHAVALKFAMTHVYDTHAGEIYWAASDVGWVVGHSFIVYAPLIQGCTTVMYEGKPIKTPDPGAFWRVIEAHSVKTLFTAPTAIRAIRREDPQGKFFKKHKLDSLRYLFLAGERTDEATYEWVSGLLGKNRPVIDNWWQTESGWPMLAQMPSVGLIPIKPGSAGRPVCGYDIQILSEKNVPLGPNQEGAVCVRLPLPPGNFPTLWQDDKRFRESYLDPYPGYYYSGDGGYFDEEGYFYITGRMDDVINVAGHRLSTSAMEEIVASHPAVAECAVFGVEDKLKGHVPLGVIVVQSGIETKEAELERELIQMVRNQVGAVAAFKRAVLVHRLPKTRSGKILRRVMRSIADGKPYAPPSTIEDISVLDEIHERIGPQKEHQPA